MLSADKVLLAKEQGDSFYILCNNCHIASDIQFWAVHNFWCEDCEDYHPHIECPTCCLNYDTWNSRYKFAMVTVE